MPVRVVYMYLLTSMFLKNYRARKYLLSKFQYDSLFLKYIPTEFVFFT
jgi:hypothetical protein